MYDPDGNLLCFGRQDHQIKIHGQRVELGEIESLLGTSELPVAVICVLSKVSHPQLVLFFREPRSSSRHNDEGIHITSNGSVDSITQQLSHQASQVLPSYMTPGIYVGISAFPLSTTGKTDREALRKLYEEFCTTSQKLTTLCDNVVQPRSTIESAIYSIVCDMFNQDKLCVTADLVDSLLDSLAVMRLAAGLRQRLDCSATMQSLMRCRSVRLMAEKLEIDVSAAERYLAMNAPHRKKESKVREPGTVAYSLLTEQSKVVEPFTVFSHQHDPNRPQMYCIHEVSGLSTIFKRLVPYVSEVELIGINNPRFGDGDAFQDVREMAHHYVSQTHLWGFTSLTLYSMSSC